MDIQESKTVDMLTKESVSIRTQKFVVLDGAKTQVGNNHRCSYSNSEQGRQNLQTAEPEPVVQAVLAIWGDEPSVTDNLESETIHEDMMNIQNE